MDCCAPIVTNIRLFGDNHSVVLVYNRRAVIISKTVWFWSQFGAQWTLCTVCCRCIYNVTEKSCDRRIALCVYLTIFLRFPESPPCHHPYVVGERIILARWQCGVVDRQQYYAVSYYADVISARTVFKGWFRQLHVFSSGLFNFRSAMIFCVILSAISDNGVGIAKI